MKKALVNFVLCLPNKFQNQHHCKLTIDIANIMVMLNDEC
jgi:hypothetical protein